MGSEDDFEDEVLRWEKGNVGDGIGEVGSKGVVSCGLLWGVIEGGHMEATIDRVRPWNRPRDLHLSG